MKVDIVSWSSIKFGNQTKKGSSLKKNTEIDYKDINTLKNFVSESGRILSMKSNDVTRKQQNKITQAIKRARFMALMSYVNDNRKVS